MGKTAEALAEQRAEEETTNAQRTACAMFGPMWYLALHKTYLNFLFPVLATYDAVLLACLVKFGTQAYKIWKELKFSGLFLQLALAQQRSLDDAVGTEADETLMATTSTG